MHHAKYHSLRVAYHYAAPSKTPACNAWAETPLVALLVASYPECVCAYLSSKCCPLVVGGYLCTHKTCTLTHYGLMGRHALLSCLSQFWQILHSDFLRTEPSLTIFHRFLLKSFICLSKAVMNTPTPSNCANVRQQQEKQLNEE